MARTRPNFRSLGKCMRNHSAPQGKPRGAKQPLGQSTASLQSRRDARLRSDQATSKWRTTLRDHKIVQNCDDSWSVVHWNGTTLASNLATVSDATAFAAFVTS